MNAKLAGNRWIHYSFFIREFVAILLENKQNTNHNQLKTSHIEPRTFNVERRTFYKGIEAAEMIWLMSPNSTKTWKMACINSFLEA